MAKKLLVIGLAWALAIPHLVIAQAQTPTADPELAKGIRQAQTGDFENAVLTLDAVAKRLAAQGGRPKELSRAYVYLSIAYLGLSQEQKAKAQFLEAWKMDKGMELSPKEFPPKALQFFEEARKEALNAETVSKPASTSKATEPRPIPAKRGDKAGSSRKPLILVALGGAAAAAVLVATKGKEESATPTTVVFQGLAQGFGDGCGGVSGPVPGGATPEVRTSQGAFSVNVTVTPTNEPFVLVASGTSFAQPVRVQGTGTAALQASAQAGFARIDVYSCSSSPTGSSVTLQWTATVTYPK